MLGYPAILGVFSFAREETIGTGTTVAKKSVVTYWYARQPNDIDIEVQPLNGYHVPSGVICQGRRESVPAGRGKSVPPAGRERAPEGALSVDLISRFFILANHPEFVCCPQMIDLDQGEASACFG